MSATTAPAADVALPVTASEDDKGRTVSSQEANITASQESNKIILLRATLGEFMDTFMFLFIAMAIPWNMKRFDPPVNPNTIPTTGAMGVSFFGVAIIYSFADISGAHFNPAVTFATMVTGKTAWGKGLCYMGAQCIGSIVATLWFFVVYPNGLRDISSLAITNDSDTSPWYQLMTEFTLCFFLVYVIFSVAFDPVDTEANVIKQYVAGEHKNIQAQNMTIYTTTGDTKSGFAPVSIGFTLGMLSLVGGSVSGGAYNPARIFGPALVTGLGWNRAFVYWVGDFAGAAAAGFTQSFFVYLKRKAAAASRQ